MGIGAAFKAVLFVGSVIYQNKKQNQLKKKQQEAQKQQEAAAEERRGFTFTTSGEAVPIPIAYGKNLIGGIAVGYRLTNSFSSFGGNANSNFAQGLTTNQTYTGQKNEFLHVKYALCQGGITGVSGVKVNNLDYNDPDQRFTHIIRTRNNGGSADGIDVTNGGSSTDRFTGCAFAVATFKLDRDDPQYNGSPEMGFILRGRQVRQVNLSGSTYSIGSYVNSNNPALCLLDYLLDPNFGRGLSTSEVDLKSFYEAAIVCNMAVGPSRAVGGVINGGAGTRAISLYECNVTLSPASTIRDNIETIMNTMAGAELTWTSEGKYKLLVEYPTTLEQQNALVDANHYFTDDDIIRDNININWPSASERYNQMVVTFFNEHEDFKSDSITFPTTGSAAHTTYLTEDNNQPFVGNVSVAGVTDPYHALATAEQLVREARSARSISLTVTKKGLSVEPGDFINITSVNANIDGEVYRVQSIEVNSDFTVKLECNYFDFNTLAWNVNDDIAYSVRPTYDFKVEPVTNLNYTAGRPQGDPIASAELTWTSPTDGSFKSIVYYDTTNGLVRLGETANDSFLIYPKPQWVHNETISFTVKAQTPLGRLSTGVSIERAVPRNPEVPTSFSVVETLYQTNKASGVKARATLSWSEPLGGVEPQNYKVEYYRVEDGDTIYKLLGFTVGTTYVFDDVRAGNYYFRITPISWFNYEGTALVGTKNILGLSAIPNDPTGFVSKVTDSGILLTWDTPTDLDVVSGGTTEIRYVRNDVVLPKWEIAQTIVSKISGSTNTATLPIADGYYLIKHFDSSGNACANAAVILNSFVGLDYNAIETIAEDPTFAGKKINCNGFGPELVTNGTFDTDTDWNKNSSWTISGGVATLTTPTGNISLSQTVTPTAGSVYKVVFTLSGRTAGDLFIRLGGNTNLAGTFTTNTTHTAYVVAENANALLLFIPTATFNGTIDNVSVQEVGELVTNGTFDTNTTGWSTNNGTFVSTGGAGKATSGSVQYTSQAITTVIGSSYQVSVDIVGRTAGSFRGVRKSDTPVPSLNIVEIGTTVGTHSKVFVATSTTTYIIIQNNGSAATDFITVDNISVREDYGDNLVLNDGVTTMTYLFDNSIDLGSVENIRLVPSLTALITDGVTVVADYDPVSTVTRFAGPIVDASVSFEVRTTNDDPTGSPTWSDWETFTVGNYRNRAFEFRLTAVVASTTYTVEISGLSLTADKADVNKRGTSTSSASADTTVTFANSFYGGIGGTDVPYIGISTTGGGIGDTVNITSITKDDFSYSVYNSGARVSRLVSWQAVGQ
jgi:hypothetical protein